MDFSLLINRRIIDVLIGDVKLYGEFSLPYMSGPDLCNLSTSFGLARTYTWGSNRIGANKSRWEYMQDLLKYLNSQGRIPELLAYIIQQGRFENLTGIGDIHKVDETYKAIIKGMLDAINAQLVIARVELRLINKQFVMAGVGDEVVIETPKVKIITSQYIRELPERIQDDIENKEYDSVITKSRTLLEEVLIFIIEKMTFERYKSNGDLVKIYQDATELLNMRQKGDWDKRVIGKTGSGLIVSALAFQGNPYDGHTLSAHSEQIARLTGYEPVEALTDRGYRGKKRVGNMAISIPSSGSPG